MVFLPLQSTNVAAARLFPYLRPEAGLMQLPQILSPPLITESHERGAAPADGAHWLPVSGPAKRHRAGLEDHGEHTVGLSELFINSSCSLEVEVTFFGLTNCKLLLQGHFLHCALSLKTCANASSHLPSLLFWVLPLNWERASRDKKKKKKVHITVFLLLKLSIWQLHFQHYGNESPCLF